MAASPLTERVLPSARNLSLARLGLHLSSPDSRFGLAVLAAQRVCWYCTKSVLFATLV